MDPTSGTLYTVILNLLIAQGLMGAFDTVWHHELRCALPQQHNAAPELRLHAIRAVLYGVLFGGLAWFAWGGAWLVPLWAIVAIEILLTLRDFVVEDQTRSLPPSERVTHTVLAINGGVIFGLLAWHSQAWWELPSGLHFHPQGWQSWVLSVFALGVAASGVRDAFASRSLAARAGAAPSFDFAGADPSRRAQLFLLTGGTGFIGQALVRSLLADGHRVTIWARNPRVAAQLFDGRAACVGSLAQIDPAVRFDVVINLAGAPILGPRWSAARKRSLVESRVGTTRALAAWLAAAAHRPRLMINGSAVGFYGIQGDDDLSQRTEASAPQDIFASQLCQQWEDAARAVTPLGIPLAILRLGVVYGHQGALPAMLMPVWLGLGGPMGSGRQAQSWVHIHDVLGVIAWLCRGDAAQAAPAAVATYNLVAPDTPSQAGFVRAAATLLRRPAFMPTPAWPMRLALGEQATLLLDGLRVAPARLQQEGYAFRFPTLQLALEDLLGNGRARR
ncbi:TIGR01777 family oxidoreductase [Cupriavidus sp. UME77]|uniref:TIGR01777 family oxidoreductase n=1 Tax=Cupriavidus sp. UME77 TaxID=1862321 RepID=UPI0016014F34|nr:TIGR01777 family oxidoreductase [Cupriavidus sp. UME77]MBB1631413.1 TIGR01777 family protein [Cupriavidus sp. UME77]